MKAKTEAGKESTDSALRTRIAELEAKREDLLERALGEDIWLQFEGKNWVMVEAVTKALLGNNETNTNNQGEINA